MKEREYLPNEIKILERQRTIENIRQQIEEDIDLILTPPKYSGKRSWRERRVNDALKRELKRMTKNGHFSPIT